MFYPKASVWATEYDPLHVLLRAVHRRDYQSSMDRFTQHVKQTGQMAAGNALPWPPFRMPVEASADAREKFVDPRKLLYSKVLHGALFSILYKALNVCDVTDQVLALTVYLLEMALCYPSPDDSAMDTAVPTIEELSAPLYVQDQRFSEWFSSEWILMNMNTTVQVVSSAINAPDARAVASLTPEDGEPSVEEMEG